MTPRLSFRLAALRRMPALAGFMLLVFVMRIGISVSCEPHEFAELFAGDSAHIESVSNLASSTGDQAADHAQDHCRQCNCHHGITLPSMKTTSCVSVESTLVAAILVAHANAPPERQLRPPIV